MPSAHRGICMVYERRGVDFSHRLRDLSHQAGGGTANPR